MSSVVFACEGFDEFAMNLFEFAMNLCVDSINFESVVFECFRGKEWRKRAISRRSLDFRRPPPGPLRFVLIIQLIT